MAEVSNTRLYLGNLPRTATKTDIENHFAGHGTGEITEVKLMNGFGFIEYKDPMDARDVVPAFHGSDFMGERMTVQFARGNRQREGGYGERAAPRPRRTSHRMQISGLPPDTSWQDLKDFARLSGLDVVFSETGRESSGKGYVEFESAADLKTAIEKLDTREFKGHRVGCAVDTTPEASSNRGRSRSPPPGRRPYPPPVDDRRAPRPYSPRRDPYPGYRERSPRREDYYDRPPPRDYRSPPRRPMEDYPPPPARRPGYDDPYRRDYPPPDPYGPARPYERPPRDFPPPRDGGYPREPYPPRDYDRGRY